MNSNRISDTEIINIIDREISQGDLHPDCKAKAEAESAGNYDLMISRYFLIRIEMLKSQEIQKPDRTKAFEDRKIAAANQQLIRYRVNNISATQIKTKQQKRKNLIHLSGNIILSISSFGMISALMVLLGYNIHTLPYLLIAGGVLACLVIPYLFSKISIKKRMVSYQSTLAAICIFTCMGSATSGLILMQQNPPTYAPMMQQYANQPTNTPQPSEALSVQPAKSGGSMATTTP